MMNMQPTDISTKPRYALSYGLRLDQGTASELTHPACAHSPAGWLDRQHDVARDERHGG